MGYKNRDWASHFERDRTKQWKNIEWVPIPNKQGAGYRKIMKHKESFKIYACWIAIVLVASKCTPRGDLSKYSVDELSDLTMINEVDLMYAIDFLSNTLDWIENLDSHVNLIDNHGMRNSFDSSILFNSIQCSSVLSNSDANTNKDTRAVWNAQWASIRDAGPQSWAHDDYRGGQEWVNLFGKIESLDPETVKWAAAAYRSYCISTKKIPDHIARPSNWLRNGEYNTPWAEKEKESVKKSPNSRPSGEPELKRYGGKDE